MPGRRARGKAAGMTLADLTEEQLLARITPRLPGGPGVLVGPGDDTAVLRCDAATIITTATGIQH